MKRRGDDTKFVATVSDFVVYLIYSVGYYVIDNLAVHG